MVLRRNHYDAAFEEYLRSSKAPYVAVDEKRRALVQNSSIKSLDFIVYANQGPNLLIDVKGRTEISPDQHKKRRWENWATLEDIRGLQQWQQLFGQGFRSGFVFAYELPVDSFSNNLERLFAFKERLYAFYVIMIDEYCLKMRLRSRSWQTVFLHQQDFHELRQPVDALIRA